MGLCNSSCALSLEPHVSQACGRTVKSGGIPVLVFQPCDATWSDITDLGEWATKIAAGEIVWTKYLSGSKAKGSVTKKRYDSCSPETAIAGEKTINFTDWNTDSDQQEYIFWNSILADPSKYQFGYMTGGGLFTGFIESFTIELDNEIAEYKNDGESITGTITWEGLQMDVPYDIPGLQALLV
jgi:hypothetical protein